MLQQLLAHCAPMLTDGVSGEEVPHSVSDGRQPFEALDIEQKTSNTMADVLLTSENRGDVGEAFIYSQLSRSVDCEEGPGLVRTC